MFLFNFFRELYSAYQGKCVGGVDDERVKFEISTMLSREVLPLNTFFLFETVISDFAAVFRVKP